MEPIPINVDVKEKLQPYLGFYIGIYFKTTISHIYSNIDKYTNIDHLSIIPLSYAKEIGTLLLTPEQYMLYKLQY